MHRIADSKGGQETVANADASRHCWIGTVSVCIDSLLLQDGACRRLVGDQAVDQTSLQRRRYRRHLGRTDGRSDGQGFSRDLRRNAGYAMVRRAVDAAV